MKFCTRHWQSLKDAITTRGLDKFIAKDGIEAAKRTVGEHATEAANFEPLMMAHNMIVSNALDAGGLALMVEKEDGGEWCPICYLVENCPCGKPDCAASFEKWVDHAADGVRAEAVRLGLIALT